jgi:poly(A) polymerase
MNETLPSLAGADWLAAGPVRAVFALLEGAGAEARVVGGAVRNALMGLPVADVDFATTAPPERVMELAGGAGIKAVATGFEHGTVTLVIDGRGFEVTTLREDVETDGRRAVVRFGRDWDADARRRDFTVNALSVDAGGAIHDPVGGLGDIRARRIRFIGDPDIRIAEDRLRILRLFRFHAEYGAGDIDAAGLAAAIRARAGLRDLSAERIGQEMRRLVMAPRAAETLALMQDAGILPVVLGGVGYPAQFARLVAFEAAAGLKPSPARRLAVLGARVREDAERIAARLRLSNAERDRLASAVMRGRRLTAPPDSRAARRLLYDAGTDFYRDAIAYAAAWRDGDAAAWREAASLPERWAPPKFPIGGREAMGGGLSGPAVGEMLRALEAWWIAEDFRPNEAALRGRLQQMLAAAQ